MHIYLDEKYYFITCRTLDKKEYFKSDSVKQIVLNNFIKIRKEFNLEEFIYSILNNHYHFLTYLKLGKDLGKIMQLINGNISKELNLDLNYSLWDKYHDRMIKSEKSYYKIIGYIIGNPLKHKLVKNFDELVNYKFCSFKDVAEKYNEQGAIELISKVSNLNWEG